MKYKCEVTVSLVLTAFLSETCLAPGCIPCLRHAEDKIDKSVFTPTLWQPPFLYISLRQAEIMQNY